MNTWIEEKIAELEEYGDLHRVECACVQEDPDACNCDMYGVKEFFRTSLLQATEMWYAKGYKEGSGGIAADVVALHDQYEKGRVEALGKAIDLFSKYKKIF